MEESSHDIEFGTVGEQAEETGYDNRPDADDDIGKGHIKFPSGQLYGRSKELHQLHQEFLSMEQECASKIVFVGGYSGTGKSALVDKFIKELSEKSSRKISYISGKFGQIKAGEPFRALVQALNQFVLKLSQDSTEDELEHLLRRLAFSDISYGSDDADVLKGTLIPSLDVLLKKRQPLLKPEESSCNGKGATMDLDLNAVKYAFTNLMKAFAEKSRPVLFCIDDLQWADDASLKLLQGLLCDKSLKYVFFFGIFRSNEIDNTHHVSEMMQEIEKVNGDTRVSRMEIFNLSPDNIAEFIADSIDRPPGEVAPVAEAVYTKTLGNIFFVKQALEELVRRNALYYDVVMFQWQFGDVSRVELEKSLSSDAVEMVQSKIRILPKVLQTALAVAAFTEHTFELDLVVALLEAESEETDYKQLESLMQLASAEGLILPCAQGVHGGKRRRRRSYKFAHDCIR